MSKQSLLWALIPPSGPPSWLFGTMHIRDERVHQLSNSLYPLILQSDVFIGEMDLDASGVGMEGFLYNTGNFMTKVAYEKLRKQLVNSFHIDLELYNHLHPLLIMSAISNSLLKADHLISLDEHLWNFAKEEGKATRGLESYEDQFRILHSIEPGPIYNQLRRIGMNPSGIRRHTGRVLNLYMKGLIHEIYILSKSSMHHLRKKIIYERNKKMVNVILGLDLSFQYFITVGAGHLSGKTGIISGLRKAGWQVKSLKYQDN